jgi:hypothetical protein
MEPQSWILWLCLGAILGLSGQAIRVISGLKKLIDRSGQRGGPSFRDLFDLPRFAVSMFIGAVAGVLGVIVLEPTAEADRKTLIFLLAAGYAGTDFIEAFVRKANLSSAAGALPPGGDGLEGQPTPH